jgi:A/G-specific adenine glycosylase
MRKISKVKIIFFQSKLLSWFEEFGRYHLPWRTGLLTPYQIVISEILLQRTQAETVEKYYASFLSHYPDWNFIVARGSNELENYLRPLGLHKQRASRLMALAQEMTARNGVLPENEEDYDLLPMFGQYISNSVRLQFLKQPRPLLDVNMARVLERFFGKRELSDIRYDPFLQALALSVVDIDRSIEINWAILDFASATCKARIPNCPICLISTKCNYLKHL